MRARLLPLVCIPPFVWLLLAGCASDAVVRQPGSLRDDSPRQVSRTPHFAFHSDPLLNLHHFLYACARAEARAAGERLRGRPVAIVERSALDELAGEERARWDEALAYYTRELVGRDLLFDAGMVALRDALLPIEALEESGSPHAAALRAAWPVYRSHFWPAHDAENRAWIAAAVARLARHEDELVANMSEAYGGAWPPAPVRVDVCAYANWAGAYTTGPPVHITLGSLDANNHGDGALELLVHEASHCEEMIGALRQDLLLAFADRGAEPPRDLWHLFIFFTAGETVARTLAAAGEGDYVHYGARTGLYERGPWSQQRLVLAEHWSAFLDGAIPRATALSRIAAAIAP